MFGTAALTAGMRTKEVLFINGTIKLVLLVILGVFALQSVLTPTSAIIAVSGAAVVAGVVHAARLLPRLRGPASPLRFRR